MEPLVWDNRPALKSPILVLSFAGWSDARWYPRFPIQRNLVRLCMIVRLILEVIANIVIALVVIANAVIADILARKFK